MCLSADTNISKRFNDLVFSKTYVKSYSSLFSKLHLYNCFQIVLKHHFNWREFSVMLKKNIIFNLLKEQLFKSSYQLVNNGDTGDGYVLIYHA